MPASDFTPVPGKREYPFFKPPALFLFLFIFFSDIRIRTSEIALPYALCSITRMLFHLP